MSVMEFVLVAHAIVVGLAVAEILRGLAEMIRAPVAQTSYRLVLTAGWTLLLLIQVWWAIWRVGDREVWTFPEFVMFLLPVGILYMIARLCFPEKIGHADLRAYYQSVARVLWLLIAATYLSFAVLLQPFVFGGIVFDVFASQVAIAVLALLAIRVKAPAYHLVVIGAMYAQVLWRALSSDIGH